MARIRKRSCLVILLTIFFVFFILYLSHDKETKLFEKHFPKINFSSVVDPHSLNYNKGSFKTKTERRTKTILLFTTHFYSEVWKGLHPENLDDYFQEAGCRIRECLITYDKRKISTADVVLFHGVDFTYRNYTSKHFHALSKVRPSYQRWLFWMHETPIYYPEKENYNNLFNWTMTFTRRSDIYHPYYSYTRLSGTDERPEKYVNYAHRKTKKVAWMVSHCGMTRGDYALELQKYTDVTVYGLCGASYDKMGGVCSRNEMECMQVLIQYKFYLAFENSFCEDYVTEKYYKFGLRYGLVPIVMGARYDDLNSIPGSYIDASKFSSIEELGKYINYLDSHDDAYNKYFEWKKHFKVTDGIDKMCLVCQAAHNLEREKNVYNNFHTFWSSHNLCYPYEHVRQKLEHQITASKINRGEKVSA